MQKNDAKLADEISVRPLKILNRPLERNHFDMQKFEEDDPIFQTVNFVLRKIVPNTLLQASTLENISTPLTSDDEGT